MLCVLMVQGQEKKGLSRKICTENGEVLFQSYVSLKKNTWAFYENENGCAIARQTQAVNSTVAWFVAYCTVGEEYIAFETPVPKWVNCVPQPQQVSWVKPDLQLSESLIVEFGSYHGMQLGCKSGQSPLILVSYDALKNYKGLTIFPNFMAVGAVLNMPTVFCQLTGWVEPSGGGARITSGNTYQCRNQATYLRTVGGFVISDSVGQPVCVTTVEPIHGRGQRFIGNRDTVMIGEVTN